MRRIISSASITLLLGGLLSAALSSGAAAESSPEGTSPCSGVNDTQVNVKDIAIDPALSPITIAGCAGNAGAGSTVQVHIAHPYSGDLVVDLIAPDNSVYELQSRVGDEENIDWGYMVDLADDVANGTWNLRVKDTETGDTGSIVRWELNLVGAGLGPCVDYSGARTALPDETTVLSSVKVAGCPGTTTLAESIVIVHLEHSYISDLVIDLIAPDGSVYTLQNRTGSNGAPIDEAYTVNLAGEAPNGTWKLRVQDAESGDTGVMRTWMLLLGGWALLGG